MSDASSGNMSDSQKTAAGHGDSAQTVDVQKVKQIAHLARIGINDSQAEEYAGQMNSVLDYMKILGEVNVDDIEMTMQVNGLKSVLRKDEVNMEQDCAELLDVSRLPKISGQIAVRAVIGEE